MSPSGEDYRVGDSSESFARMVAQMDEETAELQDRLRKLGGETTGTTGKFTVYAVELERALAATKELNTVTAALGKTLETETAQVTANAAAWAKRNAAMEAGAQTSGRTAARAVSGAGVAAEEEALSAAPRRQPPRRGYVVEPGADTAGAKYDVYGPGPTGGRGERMIGTAQTKAEATSLIAEDQRYLRATQQATLAVQQRTQAEKQITTAEQQEARTLRASAAGAGRPRAVGVVEGEVFASPPSRTGQLSLGETVRQRRVDRDPERDQLTLPLEAATERPPPWYQPPGAVEHEAAPPRPTAAPEQPRLGPAAQQLLLGPAGSTHVSPEEAAAQARVAASTREAATAEESAREQARSLTAQYQSAAASAREFADAQAGITRELNQSVAAYAGQSSALSRNGALTTEFLQAFVRGDVTLQEFTSQMTSTIGKFGGWAVAGALVYGAYDAIKKLGQGAVETQEGVQNLSRFIPSVASGPGRAQAESSFRDISQQFNEPISQVTAAMSIMARMFHNVTDAANATRAVFLASRLDQIAPEQSQTYLTGVAQSLNITSGAGLVQVVGSLNALQNRLGARVSQTLPALARAAPAAEAGGLSENRLEALVAVAVRAGIPGTQAGTAILRSIGTFAYRPDSQATFRRLGIPEKDLERGNYGGLIDAIGKIVDSPKGVNAQVVEQLATALGGPLLGSRTLLPVLEHFPRIAEAEQAAAEGGRNGGQSAYAELDKVLGGVGQQFTRLGIELEYIGSELESAGLLEPVQILAQALGDLGRTVEVVISPLKELGNALDHLPTGAKDVLAGSAAAGLFRVAARSNFGFATQQGLSRLPYLSGLRNDDRQRIADTVSGLRGYELPERKRETEAALARQRQAEFAYEQANIKATADQQQIVPGLAPEELEKRQARADTSTSTMLRAKAASEDATRDVTVAVDRQAQLQDQIAVLAGRQLDLQEKINYAEEQQLLAVQTQTEALSKGASDTRVKAIIAAQKAGNAPAGNIAERETSNARTEAAAQAVEFVPGSAGASAAASDTQRLRYFVPAAEAAAESTAEDEASLGLFARMRSSPAAAALGAVGSKGASLAENARSDVLGTTGALTALIGSQIVGQAVGGGAGGAIQTFGGALGGGALAADFGGRALGGGLQRAGEFTGIIGEGSKLDLAETLSNPLLGAGLALGAVGTEQGVNTPGAAGVVESGLSDAAAGALIGAALPIGGPVIGGTIGAAVGVGSALLGHSLGTAGASTATRRRDRQYANVVENILNGNPTLSGQDNAATFGDLLNSAFNNGNLTDAQKQQTQVEQGVRQQVQLLKDVGITNPAGQGVENTLAQSIGAAASSAAFAKDPYDVGQIIDSASQGQLTANQAQFTYRLAQSPTAAGATAAVRQSVADTARFRRHIAAGEASSLTSENGAATTVAADEGLVADDRRRVASLAARGVTTGALSGPRFGATSGGNPLLGAGSNLIPDTQTGAGSQATGYTTAAGLAQTDLKAATGKLVADEAQLTAAQKAYKTQVKDYAESTGKGSQLLQNEIENTQSVTAAAVAQVTQNASGLASVAASATADPVVGAVANLNAAIKAIAYNNQERPYESAETYTTTNDQDQAAKNAAAVAKVQGIAADRQAAEAATVATYNQAIDPNAAAAALLAAAQKNLAYVKANAKKLGPQAVSAAQGSVSADTISKVNTAQQVSQQLAADTAGLAQAQNPANARAVGLAQQAQGQTDLRLARNQDQTLQAQALIAQGTNAAAEALQSTTQTTYQITEAQQTGDPVAAALTQIAAARTALAQSLGPDQTIQANLQLAQATQALHQASQSQIIAIGQLKASQTNNTLARDNDTLAAARKALAQAISGRYGASTIRSDRTAVGTAELQKFNDNISQQVASITFLQSTLQLSQQGALQRIEALQAKKGLSVSEQQQLASAAYQIETDQSNTSLFDLAPAGGAVTTPTIFDVRAAAERERAKLWAKDDRDGAARLAREREETAKLITERHQQSASEEYRKRTTAKHDVGGNKDGTAHIGGASIKTTSGELNTYDTKVEAAVKAGFQSLLGALGGISHNSTVINQARTNLNHTEKAERTASRVTSRLRSAGKSRI